MLFLMSVGIYLMLFPPHPPNFTDWENQQCMAIGEIAKIESNQRFNQVENLLYLKNISYFDKICTSARNPANHSQNQMIEKNGIICYLPKTKMNSTLSVGQRVKLKGRFLSFPMASNPGEFNAYYFYQTKGYMGKFENTELISVNLEKDIIKNSLYHFRLFLEEKIKTLYPKKEAGILLTMILGNKSNLDNEVKNLYQKAGILHILSVSGLHISILGYGFYKVLRKIHIPVFVATLICVFWIGSYGIMIGMGVSAFRAIIMFIIRMMACWFKRTYDLLTALAVAAVLLILEQPLYFYHSGFWLSFICVLAIQVLFPLISLVKYRNKTSVLYTLTDSLFMSTVVTLATLPIFLWFYYEVSFWGIVWNLFVLPLTGFVLSGGILSLVFPISWNTISTGVVWCVCCLLDIFEKTGQITDWIGKGMILFGKPSKIHMIIFMTGIFLFTLYGEKIKYWKRFLVIGVLASIFFVRLPADFSVTILDVGQGDGIFIQNDTGKSYFIDGGSVSKSKVGKKILLPFLKNRGIRTLDAVFISHADEDHMNGIIELLQMQEEGVHIEKIILPAVEKSDFQDDFSELLELAAKNEIEIYRMSTGQKYEDGNLTLRCIHPKKGFIGDKNEASLVLYLTYQKTFSMLLTGDVEGEGEKEMEGYFREIQIPPLSVLKVAHHGSKNSTPFRFLEIASPKLALISCGKNNAFGHPHQETLDRLERKNIPIYQTPTSGSITIKLRKNKMSVHEYLRKAYW